MGKFLIIIIILPLVSCGDMTASPEITKCEDKIKSVLPTPESYRLVQSDSLNVGDFWQVGIQFSYKDEQGNKIEGAWQTCDYALVDGKPDTSRFIRVESSIKPQSKSKG